MIGAAKLPFLTSRAEAGNGLLTDLTAYWPCDESSSSSNFDDLHSGGYDLTQVNTPGVAAGHVYANARSFITGSTTYGKRASESALQIGAASFTIAAGVYLGNKSANYTIISKWRNDTNAREYALLYNLSDSSPTDRYALYVSSAGTSLSASVHATNHGSPAATTWTLVWIYHDAAGDVIGIAVNDGTPNTTSYSSGLHSGSADLYLGALSIGSPYYVLAGRIGPVAYWKNRVLSSDDRAAYYASGSWLPYASLSA